jgi:hypothetical protein
MTGNGILRDGASLLWRRQRILWWLFAANFALAWIAAMPLRAQLAGLNGSIVARDYLYHNMNLFRLDEALTRPDAPQGGLSVFAVALGFVYILFLLFAIGGVLESLYTDRTPRFGEFLRASASYFWRMARLAFLFALLMIPIFSAQTGIGPLNDWIGNYSSSERLTFGVTAAISVLLALIAFAARLWIDVAQVDCVAHERRAIRHSVGRARSLLQDGFWRLYASVIAIELAVLAFTLALLWIWTKLPHEAIGWTFLIGQLIVIAWLGGRLWQKAAETAWFHQRDALQQPVLALAEAAGSTTRMSEPMIDL